MFSILFTISNCNYFCEDGNYQWSREQEWNPGSGKHSICTHFPKDHQLRYLLEDENNEGFDVLLQSCPATQWLQSTTKNFSRLEEPNEVPGADKETKGHLH